MIRVLVALVLATQVPEPTIASFMWCPVEGATAYRLSWSRTSREESTWLPEGTHEVSTQQSTATSVPLSRFVAGSRYFFTVQSYANGLFSAFSNEICIALPGAVACPPIPPQPDDCPGDPKLPRPSLRIRGGM